MIGFNNCILCFIYIGLFNNLGFIYVQSTRITYDFDNKNEKNQDNNQVLTKLNPKPQYKICEKISDNSKIIKTKSGKIKGECYTVPVKYSNGKLAKYDVFTWLGVPYAQPPIKENRFKRPVPVNPWSDVLDATKWKSKCMQKKFIQNETEKCFSKITLQEVDISENCLFLNIYSPSSIYTNKTNERGILSPIVVFFHGGSFSSGSGSDDVYDPFVFVATTNIIVVTINFRLGVFGSLHLSESDANGNQAILDQHTALKWIYENAFSFKGDVSKITLMGHGTGAYSVGHHLFYEPSIKLFTSAILLGGSPSNKGFNIISSSEATKRGKAFLNLVKCDDKKTNQEMVKCAQSVSVNDILQATDSYSTKLYGKEYLSSLYNVFMFPPVLNYVDFNSTFEELTKKTSNSLKVLIGFNQNEAANLLHLNNYYGFNKHTLKKTTDIGYEDFRGYLTKYFKFYSTKPTPKFIDSILKEYNIPLVDNKYLNYFNYLTKIITDQLFACEAFDFIEKLPQKSEMFVYEYAYRISSSIYPDSFGVVHGDELPLIFGEPISLKNKPLTSINFWSSSINDYTNLHKEKELTENLIGYLSNFIKFDNPNHKDREGSFLSFDLDNLNGKLDYWWPSYKNDEFFLLMNRGYKKGSLYLKIEKSFSVFDDYSSHHCKFWKKTGNEDYY